MFRKGPGLKVLQTIAEHGDDIMSSVPRVVLQAKHGDIVKRVLSHMRLQGLVESGERGLSWSLTTKGRSLLGPSVQGSPAPEFCDACGCLPCDCNWGN